MVSSGWIKRVRRISYTWVPGNRMLSWSGSPTRRGIGLTRKRASCSSSYSANTRSWGFTPLASASRHSNILASLSTPPHLDVHITATLSMLENYDVIVIGTGAGGGMAIKTLCEAGLKVCALNAGRALNPAKDFRNHRMPYDMKYRAFGDPKKRAQSYGYMDNEYTEGIWEHEISYTTAPGTKWMWPRCFAVGGRSKEPT